MRTRIAELLKTAKSGSRAQVEGWIRTARIQKNAGFVQLNDGTNVSGIQVVLHPQIVPDGTKTGAALRVSGELAENPARQGEFELRADHAEIIGEADDYPLGKKYHSLEYLRSIPHLRPRTNTFGAVLRTRNTAAMALHRFFQEKGIMHLHAPILTGTDCEGAGEQFIAQPAHLRPDSKFFGTQDSAFLTVSAQLHAEIFAAATPGVYTFGPTFRAELSHTHRHLAEFWMLEAEISFCEFDEIIDICEDSIRFTSQHILDKNMSDLEFFKKSREVDVIARLEKLADSNQYPRISYKDAVQLLSKNQVNLNFGDPLTTEHERYIANIFNGPVFVTHYPKSIKPFYMKPSSSDSVFAFDLLLPEVCEIAGGSQRIDSIESLESSLHTHKLDHQVYSWYVDLRRYGSVPHSGFGLGFDRLLLYATGLQNIRDVVPIPRSPGSLFL